MTPIEWVTLLGAIFQIIFLPAGIFGLLLYRRRTKDVETRELLDDIVLTAEEMKANGLLTKDKLDYVMSEFQGRTKKLDRDEQLELEDLIHAELVRLDLGASAKNDPN